MPATAAPSRLLPTVAILLALVVAAFEGTVVTSAMPVIAADLGGLGIYAWVFSAFLLASMIGILTCGKLADAFGRRPVFMAGMGLFLVGSSLCGAAWSIESLIAFRVIQGLGAGAIQPIAMTISADLYTLEERVRIQSLFTAAWGAANALGPLIGGILTMKATWRLVFLVNVPIGLFTVIVLAISYRDPPRGQRGPTGVGGAMGAGIAAALLLFALEPAGGMSGASRLAAAALAVAATVLLTRQQRRSEAPILPASLLPDPVVRAGVLGGVFAGGLLYACTAYVPLFLTRRMHENALTAGAALMPLLVGWAVGSTFGIGVLVRWGMRVSVGGGFALASCGALALAWATGHVMPLTFVFGSLAVIGLGLGPAASTALAAPQSHVPWQYRGMITSSIYASRMLGGSLAVAALGSAGGEAPAWRFTGIAAISLAATVLLAAIAPSQVRDARTVEA